MNNNNNEVMIQRMINSQTGTIPRTKNTSHMTDKTLPANYKATIEKINSGIRVCIVLRGLPGSGKSSLAKQILDDTVKGNGEGHIFSADNYFMKGSRYMYDASKLPEAHEAIRKSFLNHASKGYSPLIVDNTNMQYWEMFCYFQGAVQYEYAIEIMEPMTAWRWNVNILAQKNTHGVPIEKIKIMKTRYETGCTLEQMLKSLDLQIVTEPKMRLVPPVNLMEFSEQRQDDVPVQNLIDFSINDQQNANINANENLNPFSWTPPPQVFEEEWDQPTIAVAEKVEVKEQKADNPLPQRNKQTKSQKSSNPEFMPHRKNCPNENKSFKQLRELFDNVTDSYLWDLFLNCKGDCNWVAEIMYDDDKINEMQKEDDKLNCNCNGNAFSKDTINTQKTNVSANNARKQTPVRTKKVKINDSEALATKAAIEASIQIDQQFYPDHVIAVKTWKQRQPLLPTPPTANILEDAFPPPKKALGDKVVALSIDEKLILELDEKFGDGLLKFALDRSKNFSEKIFINESTAKQVYEQIMEAYYSHEVENQLEAVKNDRALAQSIHENEKAEKYPQLSIEPKGDLKQIMENEEALKQYEKDMSAYQKESETLAIVIKKQRLYKAFPDIPKIEINNLFEVLEYNFNETINMLQENHGYTKEQCKAVQERLENDKMWRSDSSSDSDENFGAEIDPNGNDPLKLVEDLREEINIHVEEQKRCYEIAHEKRSRKDFQTANYYIDMASLHKQMAEEKRLEVASVIAGIHAQDQDSTTTLDLHFHNIIEATTMLNTFLDRNISRLREIRKQYVELSIITGRGAHSKNGVATIKNMTIQELRNRNLRVNEDNPGLLKVKVFPNSVLSTELNR